MPSLSRFAATLLLSTAVVVPASVTYGQVRPAAADVIAKYVEAIGGKSDLMKLTSIKQSATMEIVGISVSRQMEMQATASNKLLERCREFLARQLFC